MSMAQVQTEASSVRKGLADRMKPRTAQSTGGRQAGGGAGQTAQRRIDPSKFLNPKAGYSAYGRRGQPPATRSGPTPPAAQPTTGATRPVGATTVHGGFRGASATAGAPPTTPGRPGGRFGAWTPRTATPVRPMPARPQAPQVAQPYGQQVPGQYQQPGRPMVQAPQVAQPMRQPMVAPQMAQPTGQPAPQGNWIQANGQPAPIAPAPQPNWMQGGGQYQPAPQGNWIQAGGGQYPIASAPMPGWMQGGGQPPAAPQWNYNPTPYPGRW